MYDLDGILARLRREDSDLACAVKDLAACLDRQSGAEEDELLALWRREQKYLWGDREDLRPAESLHTAYSVLIKLIAYNMVSAARCAGKVSTEDILSGRAFRVMGIVNYCGEDWYGALLRCPDEEREQCLARLCAALEKENTIGSVKAFVRAFRPDSLRSIYETMIPETMRTALGEYYTPLWLAKCMIENALAEAGRSETDLRFIDPTCGAGTFLTAVMGRIRKASAEDRVAEGAVAGFDINPLAVLTARTNYLAAILDQLPARVLIPIYRYDVLNAPAAEGEMLRVSLSGDVTCRLPMALCRRMVSEGDFDPVSFLRRLGETPGCESAAEQLSACDEFTARLLARLALEQIFAFFERKADIVVGNPPWVNWENLSEGYREQSRALWMDYGLYNGRGKNVRFLKDDISVLITYVVIDKFLADGGLMSFVLRQALFKSEKNGALFRKFRLEGDGTPFRVLRLDDLGKIKPFAGVNIRAALALIRKGEEHTFPVPCYGWTRKKGFLRATRTPEVTADTIWSFVERERTLAFPADREDPTSLWVNSPEAMVDVVDKVLGENGYKARTGVFTGGANAVYWLEVLGEGGEDRLRVRNVVGRARRRAETVETELERTHIYPLVQGHDIERWRVKQDGYLLCPHTEESKMRPVGEETLRRETPLTYEYLARFRAALDERRGFAGWEKEIQNERFYAILRIGNYTFSRYKVAWRYIAQSFICAVIEEREDDFLGRKLCIPNEKVMYVGTDEREEAYYLCGVLSSLPVSYAVECYMNPTSISAHVLGKLKIPAFDPHNELHRRISDLCEEGHREREKEKLRAIRKELDRAAAKLYSIDEEAMRQIGKREDRK